MKREEFIYRFVLIESMATIHYALRRREGNAELRAREAHTAAPTMSDKSTLDFFYKRLTVYSVSLFPDCKRFPKTNSPPPLIHCYTGINAGPHLASNFNIVWGGGGGKGATP